MYKKARMKNAHLLFLCSIIYLKLVKVGEGDNSDDSFVTGRGR